MKKFNILFFGSDRFSSICLDKIHKCTNYLMLAALYSKLEVVLPFHWDTPLKKYALENEIAFHRAPLKTLKEFDTRGLSDVDFNLAVVVSFGYFIPRRILEQFTAGTLNAHPSLLPKYRGAAPIQHAIMNQDLETGVSIIELSPKSFDSGKILKQTKIDIPKNVFYSQLHDVLAEQSGNDLVDTIANLQKYQANATIQNDLLVTKAPKIKTEDAQISPQDTISAVYAMYRAIGDKVPIYCHFRKKKIQIIEIDSPFTHEYAHLPSEAELGQIYIINNTLYVKLKDGWLPIKQVRVENKATRMPEDFRNGYQIRNGLEYFD
ncbi:hypothetical protein HDV06_005003 [Boothiomyces sp. JEL0866]|nr:hypothetical protein HDV06_005003 [Boothiomyces sp. JEL0866]